MENLSNVRIIRKDGSIHRYDEPLKIERTPETEHIYRLIMSISGVQEDKPA